MQKKFFSLRLIASVINLLSWCMLILALLEAFFLIALSEGVDKLSREAPELFIFIKALNAGLGLNAIIILITGLISFVLLNSVSERIRLFIEIEENTRVINQNLGKITKLLEKKFDLNAEDVDEKISIIDKITYWGQIIPIVISILFFLFILNQIPKGISQNNSGDKENTESNDSLSVKNEIIWEGQNNQGSKSIFKKTSKIEWIETNKGEIYYYDEITNENGCYTLKDKNRVGVYIYLTADKAYYKDNNNTEWLFIYFGQFK
jgi:hypothetical protein